MSHGNTHWCKPYLPVPYPVTAFEQQVEKLGLGPGQYQASTELRAWCRRNAHTHYVPENLLRLWGIRVEEVLGRVRVLGSSGEDEI